MKTDLIKTAEPFKTLFTTDAKKLAAVTEHMKEKGFDDSTPIILWKEKGIVVDGHARLQAAIKNKIEKVPVNNMSFESEEAALTYAIHVQKDRRNLTDAEIINLVDLAYTPGQRGGDRKSIIFKGSNEPLKGSAAKQTAKNLGISETKVKKAKSLLNRRKKKEVLSGKKSINKAYKESRKEEKAINPQDEKKKITNSIYNTTKQLLNELENNKGLLSDLKKNSKLPKYCGKLRDLLIELFPYPPASKDIIDIN